MSDVLLTLHYARSTRPWIYTLGTAAQAEAMATTILPQVVVTSPTLAATSSPALPDAMLKGVPELLVQCSPEV